MGSMTVSAGGGGLLLSCLLWASRVKVPREHLARGRTGRLEAPIQEKVAPPADSTIPPPTLSQKGKAFVYPTLNHMRGTEGQVCGSKGTVYNHRQLCLWGEAGAGQCPSSGFKISKAKDPEWLEQGHGIKAWKIDGGALKASCRSSTTRLRTEERGAAALGPQTAPEAQSPEAMRRVQGKSPLLRLSFPICTVGSVDWLQLPSKSFIKQASLIVIERDI